MPETFSGPGLSSTDSGTISARHLDRALGGLGFRSVYQPIIDLQRRTVVGYEALTRFDPVDTQAFEPNKWFDAANEVGVGAELDALTMACALRARPDLPRNCFLAINIDPDSLLGPSVQSVLAAQGDLTGVVIEITEHRRWEWSSLASVVTRLRSAGARFAVDDTGAGYSGLQQILELRPSILKLDRSLIFGIHRDEAKSALVEMLGLFANRIDAWVLAEGVETIDDARRLIELEVPLAQGYFFGRPDRPWKAIEPSVSGDLADHTRPTSNTLHRYLDPVAAVPSSAEQARSWLSRSDPWIAVTDGDRRPLGLLNADAALTGALIPTLVVNVHSSPAETANRIATAATDSAAPIIVTDNGGRYLGLLTTRRLLAILAKQASGEPAATTGHRIAS